MYDEPSPPHTRSQAARNARLQTLTEEATAIVRGALDISAMNDDKASAAAAAAAAQLAADAASNADTAAAAANTLNDKVLSATAAARLRARTRPTRRGQTRCAQRTASYSRSAWGTRKRG